MYVLRDRELEAPGRVLPFVCEYSDRIPKSSLRKALDAGPNRFKSTLGFMKGRTLANSLVRAGAPRPPTSRCYHTTHIHFWNCVYPLWNCLVHCVYLLQCSRCTKQHMYVGQMARPLKTRLNGHRQASSSHPDVLCMCTWRNTPTGLKIFS